MAGTYQEGQHKDLSGVYSRIVTSVTAALTGVRGIVAYPFTSDWGPVNVLTEAPDKNDFNAKFNAERTTLTASKISLHAFKGSPSLVLGYRMATDTAKKGEATLATGWVLETLYPSARSLVAKVTDSLTGGKVVEILEGGRSLAKVEGTTVEGLTTAINSTDYVRVKTAGAALPSNAAGAAFTGGNNGSGVTGTEYTAFREEVEADGRAKALALDSYADAAEVAATVAWAKRAHEEGTYITFVNGGPIEWDSNLSVANAASRSYNSRLIVNVGNGADGYTAGDLAIFIAARVASVALNRSITDEPVPYARVNRKLTKSPRIEAKRAGTLLFVQNGDLVQIDEGINTFTQVTDPETERLEFGKIRVSNALNQVTGDLEVFGDAYKRTRSNTPEARETYAALVEESYFGPLVAQEVLQPGATYRPDEEYHGPNATKVARIDEAYFVSGIQPVDSMEKIYQKVGVNF